MYGDLVPPAYRGTVNNELMHITDWLPTLASMAGVIPTSTTLDGVDQSDMLFAGAPSGRTGELILGVSGRVSPWAANLTAVLRSRDRNPPQFGPHRM